MRSEKGLLARGARVNARTNNGITALMFAAMNGYTETVHILLANGADVHVQDENGETAWMHAAKGKHSGTIQLIKGVARAE